MSLLIIFISENYSLAHLLIGFLFFGVNFLSFLKIYMLGVNPLSGGYLEKNFPHPVGCFFILEIA
jgi:hypothetical protein